MAWCSLGVQSSVTEEANIFCLSVSAAQHRPRNNESRCSPLTATQRRRTETRLLPTWMLSVAIERMARKLCSSSRNLRTSRSASHARAARWICCAAASSRILRTRLQARCSAHVWRPNRGWRYAKDPAADKARLSLTRERVNDDDNAALYGMLACVVGLTKKY